MKEISQTEHFDSIIQNNKDVYLMFFKHSTRCPISWSVKKEVDAFLKNHPQYLEHTYLINVIDSKNLSNYIAEKTKIKHESPQIIIMKDNSVIAHFSHLSITENKILEHLK
ncbi:MAG TPA: bacillithiol system redox-active protein YtxJ [Candidatus Hydrogenedens sp.]|nr:bacillithiol system redox-active protein YtxJ [Candidatus Hydrogenedens sp.]HOL20712.1 bacillithiol system redox-active protein YtxJ [Candidatus Hydrogenedens sp.]HPP58548.1 bacillithiol system redox-active protein YtxJ [Candidatus Hydrogenedens sp.]